MTEQDKPEFKTKLAGALTKEGRQALEPFAEAFFTERGGEWLAVVRMSHKERTEKVTTGGDHDEVEKTATVRIEDIEVMSGEHIKAAYELMGRVRQERQEYQESQAMADPNGLFGDE